MTAMTPARTPSDVWTGAGRRIFMQDVGTRDGLQAETAFVPTADRRPPTRSRRSTRCPTRADELNLVMSASESHNLSNLRMTRGPIGPRAPRGAQIATRPRSSGVCMAALSPRAMTLPRSSTRNSSASSAAKS